MTKMKNKKKVLKNPNPLMNILHTVLTLIQCAEV